MNILDSRDLIGELADYDNAQADGTEPDIDQERAEAIRALADEGIEDWEYGAALIPTGDFVEYAKELASDLGAVSQDAGWPNRHIDWEAAADELKIDYTEVTFLGNDYYVR